MNIQVRMLITEVYEGKTRSYISGLDQDNGGAVKFSMPTEAVPDLPVMVPLNLTLQAKGRMFQNNMDLQVIRLHVEPGAFDTLED